jgi:hypothetical protein
MLHLLVPAMGMAVVIGAVLFGETLAVQLFLVAAGLLMTEAGLWRLADPVLPDDRKYLALRNETDHLVRMVAFAGKVAETEAVGAEETAAPFAR